jgi:transposase InsO family protein
MVIRDRALGPWEHISIDILSGNVKSKRGNKMCLVVMDEFTKGVEVIPIPNSKSETIARALVSEVCYRHGIPRKIHSDRANNLSLSHVILNVLDLLGISRSLSTAFHPQGNGQVERFNRFLVEGLYCLMNKKQNDWDEKLPALLFAYRTSIHPTTGETPFFMMHGRDAVLPGDLLLSSVKHGTEDQQAYAREIYDQLQKAFEKTKERHREEEEKQKAYYDSRHRKKDVEFSPGDEIHPADLVVLYYQEPHIVGDSTKYKSTWSVPFRVVRQMPNRVNYEVANVRNPSSRKIVHVANMRRYYPWVGYSDSIPPDHIDLSVPFPTYQPKKDDPPKLSHSDDFSIDEILDEYSEGKGKSKRTWYLVHWQGYAKDEVSWVSSKRVQANDIVKAWRLTVDQMTESRKKLINVLPSKRPLKFRWDDPEDLSHSDEDSL